MCDGGGGDKGGERQVDRTTATLVLVLLALVLVVARAVVAEVAMGET